MLGTLSIHWQADYLLLWQAPVTCASLREAHRYYVDILQVPQVRHTRLMQGSLAMLSTVLLSKLFVGSETNVLFDGASLFLVASVGVLYYTKTEPSALSTRRSH